MVTRANVSLKHDIYTQWLVTEARTDGRKFVFVLKQPELREVRGVVIQYSML
jgi:hypothetical protein